MSDYEIIMLLLQVMTVVIAFGALIALICLEKDKQPFVIFDNSITERPFPNIFRFRDEPDVSTRLTIFLYYNDGCVHRQTQMNKHVLVYIIICSVIKYAGHEF